MKLPVERIKDMIERGYSDRQIAKTLRLKRKEITKLRNQLLTANLVDFVSEGQSDEFSYEEIISRKSFVIPDINQVLEKNFYCLDCETPITLVDPRSVIEHYQKPDCREREIQNLGINQYFQFLARLKKMSQQLDRNELPDDLLLQCRSCFLLQIVIGVRLANFLMIQSINNQWTDSSRIILKNGVLTLA